jgi:hypothetical protein
MIAMNPVFNKSSMKALRAIYIAAEAFPGGKDPALKIHSDNLYS